MGSCVVAAHWAIWREQKACDVEETSFNVTKAICFQSAKRFEGLREILAGKRIMPLNTPELVRTEQFLIGIYTNVL